MRFAVDYSVDHFQHDLGPVPSSRVKLTRRLTFDLTLG